MTQRERKLVFTAGGVLGVLVLGIVFFQGLVGPWLENRQTLAGLRNEEGEKLSELGRRRAAQKEYRRLLALSLPADPDPRRLAYDLAWAEYDTYLRELLRASRVKGGHISGLPPASRITRTESATSSQKKPLYTPLVFTVEARGTVAEVVDLMHRFFATPLLHRIQAVSIKPPDAAARKKSGTREVTLKLTVEALLVQGAEKRSFLLPVDRRLIALNELAALGHAPVGLALVPLAIDATGLVRPRPLIQATDLRQYASISRKNIFFAPPLPAPQPPPEGKEPREYPDENINTFIRLTSIVHGGERWEAFFYDVFNNVNTRVRARDIATFWGPRTELIRAFRNFPIYDQEGERQSALTSRIDERDLYFWYDGYYYNVHIGETLAEGFKRGRLTPRQVADLGLPPEPEK